jgi:hypothetical protein
MGFVWLPLDLTGCLRGASQLVKTFAHIEKPTAQ